MQQRAVNTVPQERQHAQSALPHISFTALRTPVTQSVPQAPTTPQSMAFCVVSPVIAPARAAQAICPLNVQNVTLIDILKRTHV